MPSYVISTFNQHNSTAHSRGYGFIRGLQGAYLTTAGGTSHWMINFLYGIEGSKVVASWKFIHLQYHVTINTCFQSWSRFLECAFTADYLVFIIKVVGQSRYLNGVHLNVKRGYKEVKFISKYLAQAQPTKHPLFALS